MSEHLTSQLTANSSTQVLPEMSAPASPKKPLAIVGRRGDHHDRDDNKLSVVKQDDGSSIPALVSVKEIAMRLGINRRSVWRLVASGDLPQPILVGGARRWFESDIVAYLSKQTAERDAKSGKSRALAT